MKLRIVLAAAAAAFLCSAGAASAAIYMKFEGVKGESKAARGDWIEIESFSWGATSGARKNGVLTVKEGADPVAVGLLLPAVQKVRDAAAATPARSVPKGTGIGAGKASHSARQKAGALRLREANGKEWTLYDVEIVRPRASGRTAETHRLPFTYACREWAHGADKGGDCTEAAKKKKGTVDYGWKVEEGVK